MGASSATVENAYLRGKLEERPPVSTYMNQMQQQMGMSSGYMMGMANGMMGCICSQMSRMASWMCGPFGGYGGFGMRPGFF